MKYTSAHIVAARCMHSAAARSLLLQHLRRRDATGTPQPAAEAFEDPELVAVVGTTEHLHEAGSAISPDTVSREMKRQGVFPGHDWWGRFVGAAFSEDEDLSYHLRVVAEDYDARLMADAIGEAHEAIRRAPGAADAVRRATDLRDTLSRMSAARHAEVYTGPEITAPLRQALEIGEALVSRCPTGWPSLTDALSGGFIVGRLAAFYALTSHGKTLWMDWTALRVARRCKKRGAGQVVGVDNESIRQEKLPRLVAMLSGVPTRRIEDVRRLTADERERVEAAMDEIESLPLTIAHMPGASPGEMRSMLEAQQAREPITLATVDYIQKVSARGDNEMSRVNAALDGLDVAAARLGIPVVIGGQISSKAQKRDGFGIPGLDKAYHSDKLVQSPAQVMVGYYPWLHREQMDDQHATEGAMRGEGIGPNDWLVAVRKAKGGGGIVEMRIDGMTIRDLKDREHPSKRYAENGQSPF